MLRYAVSTWETFFYDEQFFRTVYSMIFMIYRYVDESIAVCGTTTSYENSETGKTEYVRIYDCPANSSFYTWDALLGELNLVISTF